MELELRGEISVEIRQLSGELPGTLVIHVNEPGEIPPQYGLITYDQNKTITIT